MTTESTTKEYVEKLAADKKKSLKDKGKKANGKHSQKLPGKK